MQKLQTYIYFLLVAYSFSAHSDERAHTDLQSYAHALGNMEKALGYCESQYTERVSCDFNSIFSVSFAHKRTWCDVTGSRSKPTNNKKWKSCVENVEAKYGKRINYKLNQADSKILESCKQIVGGASFPKKLAKAHSRKLYRGTNQLIDCLRSRNPRKLQNDLARLDVLSRDRLEKICLGRVVRIFGRVDHCSSVVCSSCSDESFNEIRQSDGDKLERLERTKKIIALEPSTYDSCILSKMNSFGCNSQNYFGPYKCTADCSGHKAGYEWARQERFYTEGECLEMNSNNSQSFLEGCLVYVSEQ